MTQGVATQNERGVDWKTITTLISIAAMVLSLGVTWGTQRAAIAENARRVIVNTDKIGACDERLVEIQVSLARIETDLQYVRARLDKIEAP